MASAKRHRRAEYWFQTIILRLIDLAVMNTRAIMKTQGREMEMVELQRAMTFGLAATLETKKKAVTAEARNEKVGSYDVSVTGPGFRLDNKFHAWNSRGNVRRQCAVHRSFRCMTNKYCVKCDTALCDGESFLRFHTLENYIL